MITVILNATLCDGANEFIACLEEMCQQRNITISTLQPCNDTCIILASKQPVPADAPPANSQEQISPPIPPEVPYEEPSVQTVASEPAPQQEMNCGEVAVLSLTTQCAVPVKCDSSIVQSKMCVAGVERVGDSVFFEYCGSTYKYPMINSGYQTDVINNCADGNQVEGCIRIVMQFTDTMMTHAIAVQVCEKLPEDPYHIVLGSDLTYLHPA